MRPVAMLTLLVMLLSGPTAAGPGRSASLAGGTPEDDWPCAMLMHMPGNGPVNDYGLIMAVWTDGTMLFSSSPCRPGEHLLVGQADPADVQAMISAIVKADFFGRLRDDPGVPDAGYDTIGVRVRARKARSFHGSLSPGFGKNADPDADYWKFVKTFRRCRAELLAISPHGVERLAERLDADGTFRGYNARDPVKTAWLHWDAWR